MSKQLRQATNGKSYEKGNVSVVVKDLPNSFEKSMSKFKARVKQSQILMQLSDRMHFTKPSAKRREIVQRAKSRQLYRKDEE